jgi:glucokinase
MDAEPVEATRVHYNPEMVLAGDVGGTKTRLGLFEPDGARPRPHERHSYPTNEFGSFTEILDAFARDVGRPLAVDAAAIGVAGPVVSGRAKLTNIEWDVSHDEIRKRLNTPRAELLNDLEAMANGIAALNEDEVEILHEGRARADGNAAVIAAGTGLGQAYLHRVDGRLRPFASEGGHADFAARTDRELELVRMLRDRYGRAEVEQVLSGPGLVNLHHFTHLGAGCPVVADTAGEDAPAQITRGAMSGRCQFCAEALRMFAAAYGAEAGNLALRGVATAGVFLGGGIAPKILPALHQGEFVAAFLAKSPLDDLISRIPVKVILNADAGLIGAAVHAQRLMDGTP